MIKSNIALIIKFLSIVSLSIFQCLPLSAGEIPQADPSIYDDHDSRKLLELSFVGVQRTATRNYLANYRPETVEGLFCLAWQAGQAGKKALEADLYSKVLFDQRAWKELKCAAATNRAAIGGKDKYAIDAMKVLFEEGDIDMAYYQSMEEKYRIEWVNLTEKNQRIVKQQHAAYLMMEARYYLYEAEDFKKAEKIVSEIWSMDLDQWSGKFNLSMLFDLRFDEKLFRGLDDAERLNGDGFLKRLLKYQQKTADSEEDPIRRAVVAQWCIEVARKVFNLDKRHNSTASAAFAFLSPDHGGALKLAPTGEALALAYTIRNAPRDGTYLPEDTFRSFSFRALNDLPTHPVIPDADWYNMKGKLAGKFMQWQKAKSFYDLGSRAELKRAYREHALINYWAAQYYGPKTFSNLEVIGEMEKMLADDPNESNYAYYIMTLLSSGDIVKSEKSLKRDIKAGGNPSYSESCGILLKKLRKLVDQKQSYLKSNPLENSWKSEFGKNGISVQLNFATGSDELPNDVERKLAPILKLFANQKYSHLAFRVEGHTDSTGNAGDNESLSVRRAQSLALYLHEQKGVPYSRFEVEGFGSRRPIATNLTKAGKSKNRRVELNLVGNLAKPNLVTTGTVDDVITAVSVDGKLMLDGNGDVWDTEQWVRLYKIDLPWKSEGVNFSPDGRRLLICVNDDRNNSVGVILNARTGVLESFVLNPSPGSLINGAVWSPDSKRLAITTLGFAYVYNLESSDYEFSVAMPGSTDQALYPAWVKGGSGIALAGHSAKGRIFLIDVASREIEELKVPDLGYLHSMASSYDGRYLYIGDDDGAVLNWDSLNEERPTKKAFWRTALANGQRLAATHISPHPVHSQLVALNCMHTGNWGVVNFKTGEVHSDKSSENVDPEVFWGRDGEELLISGGWVANEKAKIDGAGEETGIYRMDFNTQQLSNQSLIFTKGLAAELKAVYAFEKLDIIAAVSAGGISIWDVKTGRQAHEWKGKMAICKPGSNSETGILYGLTIDEESEKSKLYRYDLNTYQRKLVGTLAIKADSLSIASGVVCVGGASFDQARTTNVTLVILDAKTGKQLAKQQVKALTSKLRHGKMTKPGIEHLELSPSGKEVTFVTRWQDGYQGWARTISGKIVRWSWNANELAKPFTVYQSSSIESIAYENENLLRISANKWSSDDVRNLRMGTWGKNKSRLSRPFNTCDTPLSTAFTKLNIKIEFSPSGEISFIRRDTGKLGIRILKKGAEWIAYTDEGYFVASPKGTDKVFWKVGGRMLPMEVLRSKFERPALLANRLKDIMNKKVVSVVVDPRPAIDPDLFKLPYKLKVISDTGHTTKDKVYKMKVEVEVDGDDTPAPVLVWTVNGHTGRGFKVVPVKSALRKYTVEHEFPLSEGNNVLSVALRYKSAVVMPNTVTVKRSVAKKSNGEKADTTAHLWFFGVGVKDYEKVDQNLNFADKDATELAKMFKKQEGQLYKQVHTKVITNKDATVRNIKIEMNRFFKQASAEDIIVIFLAGHGIIGSDQELYFVAHDSDMDEPYTGLEMRDFAAFLERRPANQKALFMMDICHAGSFPTASNRSKRRGNGLSSDEAVKLVSQGTGTVVLASSTGRESSYENKKFRGGHGAFTAALLDGLEGKADAIAGNSDGYVFLTELTSFVGREVPRLTNGAQHPTTPRMENLRDFPLGKSN